MAHSFRAAQHLSSPSIWANHRIDRRHISLPVGEVKERQTVPLSSQEARV